jgi:hypothetical protein
VRVVEYPAGRSGSAACISSGGFSGNLEGHANLTIKSGDFDIVFASDLFAGRSGFVMSYQVSILFCTFTFLSTLALLLCTYFALLPTFCTPIFALLSLHSYLCTPTFALPPTLHSCLFFTPPTLSCHTRSVLLSFNNLTF